MVYKLPMPVLVNSSSLIQQNLFSHSSEGEKSKSFSLGPNQGVTTAMLLLEALRKNLFLCLSQLLELHSLVHNPFLQHQSHWPASFFPHSSLCFLYTTFFFYMTVLNLPFIRKHVIALRALLDHPGYSPSQDP